MIRVLAYREIRQNHVLIPEGTPGKIVRTTGTKPAFYTVEFWPEAWMGQKLRFHFFTKLISSRYRPTVRKHDGTEMTPITTRRDFTKPEGTRERHTAT